MDNALGSFQLPDSWRFYVASLGAMLALAGLDFVGAMFAKEWAERGRLPMFMLGWVSFSILFFVYARILKVAELSTVTIGWIVFLQVGLLLLDSLYYEVRMPWPKWAAIAVILVLQIYLIAAPNIENAEASGADSNASGPSGLGNDEEHLGVHPESDDQSSADQTTGIRRPGRPLGPGVV